MEIINKTTEALTTWLDQVLFIVIYIKHIVLCTRNINLSLYMQTTQCITQQLTWFSMVWKKSQHSWTQNICMWHLPNHFISYVLELSELYWKGLYHLGNIKGNIGKGRAEFQVPMSTYTFQVLYCHQINILFIIFASDIENYIATLTHSDTRPH